jgi:hypothetical protein
MTRRKLKDFVLLARTGSDKDGSNPRAKCRRGARKDLLDN